MKKKAAVQALPDASPIEATTTRNVPSLTRLHLFVRAGGRCQFRGCNKDVMMHDLTQTEGIFAEMAHVVAFKENGARGKNGPRPEDVHDIKNLLLLHAECHKLIDDNPGDYPRALLEQFKEEHETRIRLATAVGPEMRSAVVILTSPIRGQEVSVREDHVREAMLPHYPLSRPGTLINLNPLKRQAETPEFLALAQGQIDRHITTLFQAGGEAEETGHLSVFGIAPIVQLVQLGAALSNKVQVRLHQRHRDTENWTWKKDGAPARYQFSQIKTGSPNAPIALVLALSGTIPITNLPQAYQDDAWVYQITLEGQTPAPTFLRQTLDLDSFRSIYLEALGEIAAAHGLRETISLFPAIPAPVAVLCGRERLPKVHPRLRVYDFDHAQGGFKLQGEIPAA